ncbi:MAG: hypothetical protein OEW39_01065 [Deltaproteobacteria bacterium]|nr:hypothetical protein [Deltaproteobacteria bacterium]
MTQITTHFPNTSLRLGARHFAAAWKLLGVLGLGLLLSPVPPAAAQGVPQPQVPAQPSVTAQPAPQASETSQAVLPVLKPNAREEPKKNPLDFKPIPSLNLVELKRMIQIARESGLADEQVSEIIIEDVDGRKIKALDYIVGYERWRKAQKAQERLKETKVYLTPQDVLTELNATQAKDVNRLRDELLLVD